MKQIEPAVIRSFRNVKTDVVRMQGDMLVLSQTQERFAEEIKELKAIVGAAKAKRNNSIHRRQFVASKNGKKFHTKNCPYGKNIKPKLKLTFLSKVKALNQGLKPCACVA